MSPDRSRPHAVVVAWCGLWRSFITALLLLAASPAILVAQIGDTVPVDTLTGGMAGVVADSAGTPVRDALVDLTGAGNNRWHTSTNSAGRFAFSHLPIGRYVMRVRKLGYRIDYSVAEVSAGSVTMVAMALRQTPTQLHELVIEAPIVLSASGFEHRRQTGAGYYVTATEIAKRKVFDFAGVLDLSPVLRVSRERGGPVVTSTKPTAGGGYGCASVFIDRKPLGPLTPFPEPGDVAGMETYRPNSGPAEFGASCALVLVWTKDYRGR